MLVQGSPPPGEKERSCIIKMGRRWKGGWGGGVGGGGREGGEGGGVGGEGGRDGREIEGCV